jgi:AraC-like DNA-binding protein
MTHYCALHRAMTEPRNGNHEKAIARELQKYQRSALKEETREEILNKLQKLMEEEELYTDSEITLEELAMKLNANSRYLSQAINEVYQKNFFNYINDLRIAKAKKMLNGDQHDKLSIEGIAKVVGFQSKSSFYTAFKKTTGITPTEYKAHLNGQY